MSLLTLYLAADLLVYSLLQTQRAFFSIFVLLNPSQASTDVFSELFHA
jgi:hypothetical protein